MWSPRGAEQVVLTALLALYEKPADGAGGAPGSDSVLQAGMKSNRKCKRKYQTDRRYLLQSEEKSKGGEGI